MNSYSPFNEKDFEKRYWEKIMDRKKWQTRIQKLKEIYPGLFKDEI